MKDSMANVKVTTLNGEWMNDWFTNDNDNVVFKETFKEKDTGNLMNTDRTATKLSDLIKSIDSDIIGIREGPSKKEEMLLFINKYLNDKYSCEIGIDGSSQKIFVLYRKSFFDYVTMLNYTYTPWKFDNNGDYLLEDEKFTRTPVELTFLKGSHTIRVIIVHLKSLFINHGQSMWNDPDKRIEFIKLSLINRRRVTMEAVQLRDHVDATLFTYPNSIIMGDVNDGPGKEYFENYMLGKDITSELLESTYHPSNIFSHTLDLQNDYTAIFDDYVDNISNKKILLDRILVSPSLEPKVTRSNVEYQKYDTLVDNPQRRDGRPTDHRPVTLELDLI